jgi:hypothetical protein
MVKPKFDTLRVKENLTIILAKLPYLIMEL